MNPCWLYFVQCAKAVKVGISESVPSRLGNLQTANPQRRKLLRSVRFGSRELALASEHYWHHRWDRWRCRANGEWFKPPQYEMDKISLADRTGTERLFADRIDAALRIASKLEKSGQPLTRGFFADAMLHIVDESILALRREFPEIDHILAEDLKLAKERLSDPSVTSC